MPDGPASIALLIGSILVAQRADDPAPKRAAAPTQAPAATTPTPKPKQAATPDVAKPAPAGAASVAVPFADDPARARAEIDRRLDELGKVAEKDQTPTQKAIRGLLAERTRWLDEFEKAARARQAAEEPKPTPEAEAADRKAELDRARAGIEALAKAPETAMPDPFRLAPDAVTDAKLAEMRESIEASRVDLDDKAKAAEAARVESGQRASLLANLRADRDQIHARTAALPAERTRREAAYASAKDEDARRVARESMVNFNWEAAAEAQRLKAAEATLNLEIRRGPAVDAALQTRSLVAGLAKARVEALSGRYRQIADRRKTSLHREAAKEERKAETSDDPVEKFKARRTAELLVLEAALLEDKKNLAASPSLSLAEQTTLADRAEKDLAGLKGIVHDNRSGGLVALRLNNDFRRIGRERSLLDRNELPQAATTTTYYENALTESELSYFNDSRDDRYERDALLEALPSDRRASVGAMIDEIEVKHKRLLLERREVLDQLLTRAEATHNQVARRLRLLDEQYVFIRTNIFWVRDAEPLSPATLAQARTDAGRVARALVRLVGTTLDRSRWSEVSAEFGFGLGGAAILPPLILRVRKLLKGVSL